MKRGPPSRARPNTFKFPQVFRMGYWENSSWMLMLCSSPLISSAKIPLIQYQCEAWQVGQAGRRVEWQAAGGLERFEGGVGAVYIIGGMEGEIETAVTIVGFRRIERPASVSEKAVHWGIEHHLINLVVLDFGCSPEEKQRLREVEAWARERSEDVRLSRVTKQEAFLQTYKEAARSPIKTYFLTALSIHEIAKEPLQVFYQQLSPEHSLEELNKNAEVNLQRIGFIILRQKLESIDRRNYFHANVALITSQVPIVLELLQENLKILVKLRPMDSSSSINSEEAQRFGQELEVVGMQLPVYESERSQDLSRGDHEAIKLLNNTPGVGTYNIQGRRF